jgi:hypothetical protein
MKTKKILATFAQLTAIVMAATFIACTNDDNPSNNNSFNEDEATLVNNDAELRDAIAKGKAVKLANDILLSNKTLEIAGGKTVTIDLGGHTLDRGLKAREYNTGGQVITVRKGATLNLSNGTLTSGWGGDGGGLVNEGGTANLKDVNITNCQGDDRAGGISNHGILTMTGGAITGNISNDREDPKGGGGIFNAQGAEATLKGVTITGNKTCIYGGGGICNYGLLTIEDCTITGNSAITEGGAIWDNGFMNMKGKNIVTGNTVSGGTANNVHLKDLKYIKVTGSLTGSNIGISMESPGTFTSDYATYQSSTDPATFFTSDLGSVMDITLEEGEAKMTNATHEGVIYYYESSWNADTKTLTNNLKTIGNQIDYDAIPGNDDYKLVTNASGGDWFALGGFNNELHEYYVVTGEVKHNTLNVLGKNVHLILCDGAKLTLSGGILMYGDHNLYIHSQSYGDSMGKLVAQSGYSESAAGIGSDNDGSIGVAYNRTPGNIEIHGGDIYAKGGTRAAGIGGGYWQHGGNVTIYGGKVEARGGDGDAAYDGGTGIGGGAAGGCGHLIVYGGKVYAYGGSNSAGIGTGSEILSLPEEDRLLAYDPLDPHHSDKDIEYLGVVDIYGGYVEAHGGRNSAGIGGGYYSNGVYLTIDNGLIYAYGGDDGAGIGGGWNDCGGYVIVNGGNVHAQGDGNGAGIGSGSETIDTDGIHGGYLIVTGGNVEAYGGEDGAGIGGGEDADGGTVIIRGGNVYAKGSYGGAGIGGGEEGKGATVTITGGSVHASAGSGDTGNRAIGPGYNCDDYGSLDIGDLMMVRAERMAAAVERHDMCWYRTDVHIDVCTHPGYTADTCPYHKH